MPRPDKPTTTERARAGEALQLRRSGLAYREISTRLGYRDESGARKAVTRLLDRTEADGVAGLRALDLADAAADRDTTAMADVLADAMDAGDQPRLIPLIRAYIDITPPPRKSLVAMLRTRTERAAFDNITEEMDR